MATLQTLKSTRDAIDAKTELIAAQVAKTRARVDVLHTYILLEKMSCAFQENLAPSNEQIDAMLTKYGRICQ